VILARGYAKVDLGSAPLRTLRRFLSVVTSLHHPGRPVQSAGGIRSFVLKLCRSATTSHSFLDFLHFASMPYPVPTVG
jgi:hypothetical protein